MNALQAKIVLFRKEMSEYLIERDGEIDVLLTALVCKENPLFVGPPGTAKSLLLRCLMKWIRGPKYEVLFSKFSTPEDLFGMISVKGIKEDDYRRVGKGRLQEAVGAFGDEIFKAGPAILNTLLPVLNERVFESGGTFVRIPLRIFVSASNEYPNSQEGGKELGALFDRFLFRRNVRPIMTAAGRKRLLWEKRCEFHASTEMSPGEIDDAWAEAMKMSWSEEAKTAMEDIFVALKKEGIIPGDRRSEKAIYAAQGYAYICGAKEVQPDHLEILTSVLWDDPIEQPLKCEQVIARIANPSSMRINSTLLEVEQILAGLDPKNIKSAGSVVSKLQDCIESLESLNGPRAKKASEYIENQIKHIHMESMGSLVRKSSKR